VNEKPKCPPQEREVMKERQDIEGRIDIGEEQA